MQGVGGRVLVLGVGAAVQSTAAMAGGRKAVQLLGVVGTDESTSPLALD